MNKEMHQEFMAWWVTTGISLPQRDACEVAAHLGIAAAKVAEPGHFTETYIQRWWETTGINLEHLDACKLIFDLGLIVARSPPPGEFTAWYEREYLPKRCKVAARLAAEVAAREMVGRGGCIADGRQITALELAAKPAKPLAELAERPAAPGD